jgi:hypothetical protein
MEGATSDPAAAGMENSPSSLQEPLEQFTRGELGIIYFKFDKSQVPVIEQAIETAALAVQP